MDMKIISDCGQIGSDSMMHPVAIDSAGIALSTEKHEKHVHFDYGYGVWVTNLHRLNNSLDVA